MPAAGKIQDLALTSSGSYALVSITARRPGTSNLAWSLLERRVVAEFDDRPAHFVARRFHDQVFALFPRDDAARPFELQQIDLGAPKGAPTNPHTHPVTPNKRSSLTAFAYVELDAN